MTASAWRGDFERNVCREANLAGDDARALPLELRALLGHSLGRFFLGESGEGRIVAETRATRDPAFDADTVECVRLYIAEEWRHAREVASVLAAIGASPPPHTPSEIIFRRGRRLMGLRLKMLTIGAAEVTGIVYYDVLARRVPAASVRAIARRISDEEQRHLEFQRDFFARSIRVHARAPRVVEAAVTAGLFVAIAGAGAAIVVVEHGPLLARLGVTRAGFLARCARVAWDALAGVSVPQPVDQQVVEAAVADRDRRLG